MRDLLVAVDPFDELRTRTHGAHRGLEDALDLLRLPLSRARFTQVLRGFLGFHLVWDETMRGHAGLGALIEGRGRVAILRADLAALGESPDSIAAIPRCAAAADLAATVPAAIGSLYVMEGSTLGGRLISRALASEPWPPAGGLRYFEPYGDRTGPMWRGFKAGARTLLPDGAWPEVGDGAVRTFETLQHWLASAAARS